MATRPIALITGGSKGIGGATSERLADDGFSVVFTYASDKNAASDLVTKIEAKHGKGTAFAYKADASKVSEIEGLIKKVLALGSIKVLVANAANSFSRNLSDISDDDYESIFTFNVKGLLFLVQAVTPHLPSGGSIVLLSSSTTKYTSIPGGYSLTLATKGAVEQLCRGLSKELMPRGICINTVRAGAIDTETHRRTISEREGVAELLASWSPAHRVGKPEEVASVIAFFVSSDSGWVSGQAINVDGAATV